jgi:DNA-binding GntR family transcriptional regulator
MPPGETKKNLAYKLLRQSIITGELNPGDILNIADLSEKFSLGITPMREALIVLESDGFLRSLARTGYVITTVSLQDVSETFFLRTLLEVEAIGLAVDRITAAELTALEENRMREQQVALGNENHSRNVGYELNREFHLVIARASGNQRLTRLVEQYMDEMERMLAKDPYIIDPQQHVEILEALKQRNKALARSAMRKHIENTKVRIYGRF